MSFVDQWTRISEVIAGYRLKATNGRLVSAVPVLGRQETGVLAGLGARLRQAERDAIKAKLAPPRRLPEQELIAAAAEQAAAAMLIEYEARIEAMQEEIVHRDLLAAEVQSAYDLALAAMERALTASNEVPIVQEWAVGSGRIPESTWYVERTYTTPSDVDRTWEVEFTINWAAVERGSWYRMSIELNGTEVGHYGSNTIGPLTFLGDGRVTTRLVRTFSAPAGSTIRFLQQSTSILGSARDISGGLIRVFGSV